MEPFIAEIFSQEPIDQIEFAETKAPTEAHAVYPLIYVPDMDDEDPESDGGVLVHDDLILSAYIEDETTTEAFIF